MTTTQNLNLLKTDIEITTLEAKIQNSHLYFPIHLNVQYYLYCTQLYYVL